MATTQYGAFSYFTFDKDIVNVTLINSQTVDLHEESLKSDYVIGVDTGLSLV